MFLLQTLAPFARHTRKLDEIEDEVFDSTDDPLGEKYIWSILVDLYCDHKSPPHYISYFGYHQLGDDILVVLGNMIRYLSSTQHDKVDPLMMKPSISATSSSLGHHITKGIQYMIHV
jgi:hypothetical protein